MAEVKFSPQAMQAYESLERAGATDLLDAIDDAADTLEADPEIAGHAGGRSATDAGVSLSRTPTMTGCLSWQLDDEDPEIVRVRYLGPDPFA